MLVVVDSASGLLHACHTVIQGSAFEEALHSVPAVLQALPDDSKRSAAATSWSALLAVLQGTRATLRLSAGGALLQSLAEHVTPTPGARPALGSVCVRELAEATIAADDVGTFWAGLRASGYWYWYSPMDKEESSRDPDAIVELLHVARRCEERGTPLKLRDTLLKLLRMPSVASNLRVLALHHCSLHNHFTELMKALRTTKLEQLHLQDSDYETFEMKMSTEDVLEMAETVSKLEMLRKMTTPSTDFTGQLFPNEFTKEQDAISALLRAIGAHKSLEELHLGLDPAVLDAAALSVESMLKTSTTLTTLIIDQFSRYDRDEDGYCDDAMYEAAQLFGWHLEGLSSLPKALSAGLTQNNTLQRLHVKSGAFDWSDDDIAGLLQNTTLQHLNLGPRPASRTLPLQLAAAVRRGSTLRVMRVTGDPTGTVELARALSSRSCVVELRITLERESGDSVDLVLELAKALADGALGHTLETLRISDTPDHSGTQDFVALARALEHNCVLRTLFAANSLISPEGAAALGAALRTNRTIKTLELRNCGICDEGAAGLASGLQHNTTLQELDLSNNEMGRAGAIALADSLGAGSALERLRLHGCVVAQVPGRLCINVDDSVAASFAGALRRGCALRDLDMGFCTVSSPPLSGMRELVDAMVDRRQLGKHHEIEAWLSWDANVVSWTEKWNEIRLLRGKLCRVEQEGWGRVVVLPRYLY
ncbi:unnamed protein product [Pedinophyceae sp. YPF-701]|nr:unnamed protein product [Pedinophyceae sp. YPF-701]